MNLKESLFAQRQEPSQVHKSFQKVRYKDAFHQKIENSHMHIPDAGFITVAHYAKKENSYEQVTGFFNRDAYHLLATDGGGQYDNHASGKPTGATCQGYNYFVSMIEPDIERFCIRCCQSKVKIIMNSECLFISINMLSRLIVPQVVPNMVAYVLLKEIIPRMMMAQQNIKITATLKSLFIQHGKLFLVLFVPLSNKQLIIFLRNKSKNSGIAS